MVESLEDFYKNDREKIRKFLFSQETMENFVSGIEHLNNHKPNEIAVAYITFILNLYDKYKNSWDELQNLILSGENLLKILKRMHHIYLFSSITIKSIQIIHPLFLLLFFAYINFFGLNDYAQQTGIAWPAASQFTQKIT